MNYEEYAIVKDNLLKAALPCEVCGEPVNFSNHPIIKTWIANITFSQKEDNKGYDFIFKNNEIKEMCLCWECYRLLTQFLTNGDKLKEFLKKFFESTEVKAELDGEHGFRHPSHDTFSPLKFRRQLERPISVNVGIRRLANGAKPGLDDTGKESEQESDC